MIYVQSTLILRQKLYLLLHPYYLLLAVRQAAWKPETYETSSFQALLKTSFQAFVPLVVLPLGASFVASFHEVQEAYSLSDP